MISQAPKPEVDRQLSGKITSIILAEASRLALLIPQERPSPLKCDEALMAACRELGRAVDANDEARFTPGEIMARKRLAKATRKVAAIIKLREHAGQGSAR